MPSAEHGPRYWSNTFSAFSVALCASQSTAYTDPRHALAASRDTSSDLYESISADLGSRPGHTNTVRSPNVRAPTPTHGVCARLAEISLELPQANPPAYSYSAVATWGDIAFVSGQIPRLDGQVSHSGVLGADRTLAEAREASQICALNALAQLDASVGLDRVARILKLMVFVASAPDIVAQPSAAEGASQVLIAAFGEAGRHARTALGVPRLPTDALSEIDLVVGLRPAS